METDATRWTTCPAAKADDSDNEAPAAVPMNACRRKLSCCSKTNPRPINTPYRDPSWLDRRTLDGPVAQPRAPSALVGLRLGRDADGHRWAGSPEGPVGDPFPNSAVAWLREPRPPTKPEVEPH